MASRSLLLFVSMVGLCSAWTEERPILETLDGNLVIASAKDRNITLLTFGKSTVNINDINLVDVSIRAHDAARIVENWENGHLRIMTKDLNRIVTAIEGTNGLQRRLRNLELGLDSNLTGRPGRGRGNRLSDPIIVGALLRNLTRRVRNVENTLNTMRSDLLNDECASDPCRHGGTCIRLYNGYQCLCPPNWEGPSCNDDVNECENFAGTDLGCQNGASCTNLRGSYRCTCTSGWHGIHCRTKSNACDAQDSRELCGFGTCLPKTEAILGYTCICDAGWQSSGTDPACTTDVDECAGKHPACSMNPFVPCLNVPGSYRCASCPPGYTGNGHYCTDIDECSVDNGGCSLTPRVQCINTMGSSNCGPCPSGYQGNGKTCTYVGLCGVNNGGCHPLATCVENPSYNNLYPQCNCPTGYHGHGIGPQGCVPGADTLNPCSNNLCVHGTCHPRGGLYTCQCNPGFTGTHCDVAVNPCTPNPCLNEGTCKSSDSQTVTCECTSKFMGPRCETPRQVCGGLFKNPSGVLEYPTTGGHYAHDLNCAFVILTNSSRVLNITFTRFGFEKSQNCRYDFLQIHDGANAGAHQLGRFCGTTFPLGGTFMTTHNAVYLWLRTDSSGSNEGFSLHWNSVVPRCGAILTGEHGRINSPGSPGRYPNNRDCIWEIMVTPGKRIQFHFFSVMMEEHPTCENDYLEINETTGGRPVQLGLYCNHTHPLPLTTSSWMATVHFHSDGAGSDMGFQISYATIEGVPGCGGIFTSPRGVLTTPGYPSTYPPRLLCDWKIQLPKGERLRLTWLSFDLEPHRTCHFDSLKVFAGPDTSSPIVGTYCGKTLPAQVTIDSNEALIVFRSDWSNEFKGFQMEYETICGGQFRESFGTLLSPFYPNEYPESRTCIYEIVQPPGKRIVLTIVDMDIESGFHESCYFDSLTIYDGDNENSTTLGSLCGDHRKIPSEPFYSTHNFMYLKFVTDSSLNNHGFFANYTTVDQRCGGLLKAPTGVIQSHTGGEMYDDNESCTWTIKAPVGHVVQLTFTSFSLEMGYHCLSDYVIVYDGSSTSGQEMGRFCGSTMPPSLMTQTESMSIVFKTDSNINGEGFIAHYVFIDASKVCGGHYYAETGVINSPNYPEPYPANRECVWVITAANKHQINLEVVQFELEDGSRCTYDYLEIRNGGYETSPLVGRYCGDKIPHNFKSLTNDLYIKLVTDSSRHMGGFSLKWDSSTTGCGGTLSGSRGEITSPNYPQPYSRLASCVWKIAVSAGSSIQIVVVDFDIEDHSKCRYDYLEITSGTYDPSKKPTRYCGPNGPTYIDIDSNIVSIRFRSDYTNSGRGFHIRYETLCVRKIHGFGGVIESPNFPNNYLPSINCSWTIEAPQGNTVNLTFSHFDLEAKGSSGSCTNDYLSIKEGQDDHPDTDLVTLCGSEDLPARISSQRHQVFLNFVTDRYVNNGGFRLEWTVVGCGGHLTSPHGQITSPGYPNAYSTSIECEWLIEADHDQVVEITFVDINTEKVAGCKYDKVTLYAGADETAHKLVELCHADKPIKYTSPTNKLFVQFHSDYSFAGRGFKATYKNVDIVCGGSFSAPTGVIHSTNYPLDYPNNQNCEWLIQVDKNHVVNFTFTDFDIEDTTNCTDDYVKVFDGTTREDTLLGTFCKNVLPPPIISSGNSILVVMRTDSVLPAKGFQATFSKACGARIIAKESGTLETSSLLHLDESIINCTWIIIAEDPADHVTLSFRHLDFSGYYSWDDSCEDHYIRLYEGDSLDGPVLGTWCSTKTPLPITSTGNALTVHWYSGYGTTDDRFGAVYSVLNSACGGEYTSASGTIASPMYPESYPVNSECIWQLKTSPGNRISLTFSAFEIEPSPNCDRDYLEIREKSGIGRLIGIYCNELPEVIEASDELWVKFRSDDSGTAKGFLGEYSLIHGNELTGVSGAIASPLYPRPWKQDTVVSWRITVDFGMAVKIEFDDLHIEGNSDYCLCKVVIFDGYNEEAPELSTVCGMTVPQEAILSSSNVVFLQFFGDSWREGNYFHLNWYQVPRLESSTNTEEKLADCIFEHDLTEANNTSVDFHSVGWPNGYGTDLDCSWIFTVSPGHHLRLKFIEIDLEATQGCVNDYLSIYDGRALPENRNDVLLLHRFCHRNETSFITIGKKSVMTVNFRTDFYQNKTGFSAQIHRDCGGELFGPNGVIDFNETMNVYSMVMYKYVCEWEITVKTGKTISISFPIFEVPSTGNNGCKDNYVLLKNGETADAPLLGIGKYCGQDTVPTTLETTGNKLYVKVVSSRPQIKFKMTYREVGMACGGTFNLGESVDDQVQFSTPNYPNIPRPFTECTWKFRAVHGERLSLHFIERFDLASTPNCTGEYVEVRDGGTEYSKLLGRFCRDTAPSSMTTNTDMLYVHYYTELADPKNGFQAAVTSGQVCGGILRGKTGVIKSPNYPSTYPVDEICGWWIAAPPEHTLKLEFRDINLPGLRRCGNADYVRISERLPFNDTVNPLGVYCGSTKPEIPQTSLNEALVSFTSDNRTSGNYRGFSLNYTATKDPCSGELSGVSGEFKSTGYPNANTRSRYCDWTITVPEGSQIELEILDLDMSSIDAGAPPSFYLVFYNDVGAKSKITYRKSTLMRDKIHSTANFMRIAYWLDVGHRGLKARFNAVAPAPCGGVIENMSGSLLPPLSPYNETSFFCPWKLKVPPSVIDPENRTHATLTVTISGSIGMYDRRSSACIYNLKYIRVKDGQETVGIACGNMTQEVYTVRSPSPMNMVDILNGTFGPPISFDVQYKWQLCGGILTGPHHTIRTPTNIEYPRSCVWHAKYEDPGSAIILVFNQMNMGSCDKGFIIVRNGGALSPQIGKFCGNIKPHNITSSMNQLWIEYWASEAPADFEIQLDLVSKSCGGVIRGSNNEFTSPGFPKPYPKNAECTWEITAQPGYNIGLFFVNRFNLETSNSCEHDFVQIYDWEWNEQGIGSWKDGPKLCGRNTPANFNSTSNRLKVLFRSNDDIQGDGFQAKWEQNCGGVFEARSRDQYIESPHYPNIYPSNQICNYTINAPKDKEIWIQFLDFDIEGRHGNCEFDNVTIKAQPYIRGYSRTSVYCGKNMPKLVNSQATVNIVFMSDAYVQKRGFRFKYFMNECGGEITKPMRISPPSLNDRQYFGRLNCTWTITAPAGKSVALRFEKFDIEISHRCVYDRVEVYEGVDWQNKKQLAMLCGNITDLFPIKSASNQMTVVFRSDASNHYGSMSASVSFTNSESSGCGGRINLTKSESFKTQKTDLYDPYEDCHWRIYAGIGKNVKLTINRMDLRNGNGSRTNADGNCTGDYLEVRDGAGPLGDLVGRYCGNVIPSPIITTSNTMWIRMFTDDTLEGAGVVGTLEPIESPCGRSLWEINDTKVFTSPNYPDDFPAGIQCSWIFKSPQPYRKLRVHFEDLDMEDTEQCDGDHVEIKDLARKYISEDLGEDFVYHGVLGRRSGAMRFHRFNGDATYKYCGKGNSFDYYSSNDELRVTLKTTAEHMPKPRKFKIDVSKASCNRNYTSPQGRIIHEDITECWTTITALPNQTITLYFNDFAFYDAPNCQNNYVQIHDGDFRAPITKTLCGFMYPSPIFSTGNKLSIHARTRGDFSHGHEKYDILYTTTDKGRGCGGKLFNYAGVFTSPMYPNNYRNDTVCNWEISVPRGYQVALIFSFFDLGSSEHCSTDYLSVEDTSSGGRYETYCGGQIPATFRASGNSVTVIYFSSVNNAGSGWMIRFVAVQSTDVFDESTAFDTTHIMRVHRPIAID